MQTCGYSAATIAEIEQKGGGLRYLNVIYLVDELLNTYLHHIKDKGNDVRRHD